MEKGLVSPIFSLISGEFLWKFSVYLACWDFGEGERRSYLRSTL